MAISFVGSGAVASANPVAVPTGYAAGDVLILVAAGVGSQTTPSGWTLVTSVTGTTFVYTKIATASESAVTLSGFTTTGTAVMVAYRGCSGVYQTNATMAIGAGTTAPNTNAITTLYSPQTVVYLSGTTNQSATLTTNAGTTSRVLRSPTASKYGLIIADAAQATAGAITQRPSTSSINSTWASGAIALAPAYPTLYWVGGSGTWNSTSGTNWSATSGGAANAGAPTATTDAVIDASSGSPTVTLTGAITAKSITTTGATCDLTSTGTLTVSGNITLSSTTTWSGTGTITINSASTITAGSTTFSCSISSTASVTLGANLTLGTTNTFTWTAGTLTLSNFTLSTGLFNASGTTRVIAFGTGNITTTGSGTVVNIPGTSFSYTGTPTINISNASATAATISTNNVTETNALNFNITTGTYAITLNNLSGYKSVNFTGFTGTWSPGTAVATFYGSLTLSSGMTFTTGTGAWTFANTSGTATITSAGKTLGPITLNASGGTVALGDTFSQSATAAITLTAGTLDINSQTNTFGALTLTSYPAVTIINGLLNAATITQSSGTVTIPATPTITTAGLYTLTSGTLDVGTNNSNFSIGRISLTTGTLAFGTSGQLTLTGNSATIYSATTPTFTGTVKIVSNYSGSTGTRTFSMGTATSIVGTPINVSAGSVTGLSFGTAGTDTVAVSGNLASLDLTGFNGTFANSTRSILGNLTLDSSLGTYTSGTLVTTIGISSSVVTITSNGRTVDFPITYSATGGTLGLNGNLTLGATRTFTLTAGTLDLTNGGAGNYTLSTGIISSSGVSRAITFGTGNITTTGSGIAFNVSGTGISYTGTPTINVSNNSSIATTIQAQSFSETTAFSFNVTTGTYALTIANNSFFKSLNFTGFAGTWSSGTNGAIFYGNLTISSGMSITNGAGTWAFNNTSGIATITSAGKTLNPINQNGVGGTTSIAQDTTVSGTATLTNGTLDLTNGGTNNYTLTCNTFSSSNSNIRAIIFGTGNITITGSAAVTPLTVTGTNLTYTGTPTINFSSTSTTGVTVTLTSFIESNAFNVNFTTGTYTLSQASNNVYKDLNFTGFSGTLTNLARTIYGNLTIPASGGTYGAGINATTFAATSGTQVLTTNGRTLDFPITKIGAGNLQLTDDLTVGSSRTFTLTNGTFNANNKNVNVGLFSSNNTNTRTITMGSGLWTLSGTGTLWDLADTTNLTFNKNTANIVLSDTSTSARTFAGGGLTYNNLTIGGSTGISTLTLTGSNIFNTLSSTKTVAHTLNLTSGTTTTVTTFGITGTSGNVVTLKSSTTGSQATLSQSAGTVSVSYMNITDLNATGGAVWQAYTSNNNVDGGNNIGWLFIAASLGNFLMMFF